MIAILLAGIVCAIYIFSRSIRFIYLQLCTYKYIFASVYNYTIMWCTCTDVHIIAHTMVEYEMHFCRSLDVMKWIYCAHTRTPPQMIRIIEIIIEILHETKEIRFLESSIRTSFATNFTIKLNLSHLWFLCIYPKEYCKTPNVPKKTDTSSNSSIVC